MRIPRHGSIVHVVMSEILECRHCETRFQAVSLEAADAALPYQLFETLLSAFNTRYRRRRLEIAIIFRAPEALRSGDELVSQ